MEIDSRGILCEYRHRHGGHDRCDIRTIMCRELPLVVAKHIDRCWLCHLDLHILHLVLLDEIAHPGLHKHNALFLLLRTRLRCLRLADGNNRIPDGLHFHQENIWVSIPSH